MKASRPWQRVLERADRTSTTRNRYADLLRAASIVVVVNGHWLMAAPAGSGAQFTLSDMLHVAPWTHWLTWLFQVMPLFFMVGGYANAASWRRRAAKVSPIACGFHEGCSASSVRSSPSYWYGALWGSRRAGSG